MYFSVDIGKLNLVPKKMQGLGLFVCFLKWGWRNMVIGTSSKKFPNFSSFLKDTLTFSHPAVTVRILLKVA